MAHFTISPLLQSGNCSPSLNVISPTFSSDILNSPTRISNQFPEGFLLKFSLRVRVFQFGRMMVSVTESSKVSRWSIFTTNTTSYTVRGEKFIVWIFPWISNERILTSSATSISSPLQNQDSYCHQSNKKSSMPNQKIKKVC